MVRRKYIKDISIARKAEQNHLYIIKYCKFHKDLSRKKMKIVGCHFPKINQNLKKENPYLENAYKVLMRKKSEETINLVAAPYKKLCNLMQSIAKIDCFKPL